MIQDFDRWLTTSNYRASTVQQSLQQLGKIREAHRDGRMLPEYCAFSARRVLAWLQETQQDTRLQQYLAEEGVQPMTRKLRAVPKQRKLEARSFGEDEWAAFSAALDASDDPRDRVIEILCVTGIRIGDALRIPTTSITSALRVGEIVIERKGGTFVTLAIGVIEPWQRLHRLLRAENAPTVAALLSPSHPSPLAGDGPYSQIDRRLKWWQTELGLSGRIHTHKMRRTFAIRLYNLTHDVMIVQQGLNNGAAATQQYLDEPRTAAIAGFQKQLRGTK